MIKYHLTCTVFKKLDICVHAFFSVYLLQDQIDLIVYTT